jgi:hypothetical protein
MLSLIHSLSYTLSHTISLIHSLLYTPLMLSLSAGDDASSWACDGVRKKAWNATQGHNFGVAWKGGDVLGLALEIKKPADKRARKVSGKVVQKVKAKQDGKGARRGGQEGARRGWQEDARRGWQEDEEEELSTASCSFSVNGSWAPPMGVAFEAMRFKDGLRPAFTLGERVELAPNFGSRKFAHSPPSADYQAVCTAEIHEEMFQMLWTRWQKVHTIHSSHSLLSYTPLIHSSHTLLPFTPLVHSSHTLLSHTRRKRC